MYLPVEELVLLHKEGIKCDMKYRHNQGAEVFIVNFGISLLVKKKTVPSSYLLGP